MHVLSAIVLGGNRFRESTGSDQTSDNFNLYAVHHGPPCITTSSHAFLKSVLTNYYYSFSNHLHRVVNNRES